MDVVKVVIAGLITVIASIIVRQIKPEIAMLINIAGCIIIIIFQLYIIPNYICLNIFDFIAYSPYNF